MPENLHILKHVSLDSLHLRIEKNLEIYKQAVLKIEDFFAHGSVEDHRRLSKVKVCGESLKSVFGEKKFFGETKEPDHSR